MIWRVKANSNEPLYDRPASDQGLEPRFEDSKSPVLPLDEPDKAPRQGFEPQFTGSEPVVLPLNDLGMCCVGLRGFEPPSIRYPFNSFVGRGVTDRYGGPILRVRQF